MHTSCKGRGFGSKYIFQTLTAAQKFDFFNHWKDNKSDQEAPLAWMGAFKETISRETKDTSKWLRDWCTRGTIFEKRGNRESDLMGMDEQQKDKLLQDIMTHLEHDFGYTRKVRDLGNRLYLHLSPGQDEEGRSSGQNHSLGRHHGMQKGHLQQHAEAGQA